MIISLVLAANVVADFLRRRRGRSIKNVEFSDDSERENSVRVSEQKESVFASAKERA